MYIRFRILEQCSKIHPENNNIKDISVYEYIKKSEQVFGSTLFFSLTIKIITIQVITYIFVFSPGDDLLIRSKYRNI